MTDVCPFCDYAGPSEILADYGVAIVFEPLGPVTPGHVLVVPRMHTVNAFADPRLTGQCFDVAARWACESWGGACNLITSVGTEATQTIDHFHVHVVPRREGDGLMLPWSPR